MHTPSTPFQKAIEAIESLPIEDRETVIEVLRLRQAEQRRNNIASHAKETISAVRKKEARFGTIDDLRKDLKKP